MVPLPKIIQGGMSVAISNWRLAQTVSRLGQLGVIGGTALDMVMARRLEDGDPDLVARARTAQASAVGLVSGRPFAFAGQAWTLIQWPLEGVQP
jgi:NAD(P)H-dependent flavin oxidoreductase YrpB (nitropropane dioxygenase family)